MSLNFSISYVLAFICVLAVGDCIECPHCETVIPPKSDEDPCIGIEIWKQCEGDSVCLVAKYHYESTYFPKPTETKTCFPKSDEDICQAFYQNLWKGKKRPANPIYEVCMLSTPGTDFYFNTSEIDSPFHLLFLLTAAMFCNVYV